MRLQLYCVLLILQSLTRGQERFSQDSLQLRNKTGLRELTKDGVDRVGTPGEQCPTSYDDCGKPDTKERVIDCSKCRRHKHGHIIGTSCDSPSPPMNVNYSFHFNTTTLKLSLELTWDPPDFGYRALWGYDVYLDGGRCIQIIGSGKEDGHYTYHGLDYDKYHVVISSLPRKDPKFKNSWDGTVEPSEDKCTMFKKHRKEPPFECRSVKNLRILQPCVAEVNKSGAVVIAFDRPQWNDYDAIIILVFSSSQICMADIKYKPRFDKSVIRNTTTRKIAGVKVGCSYTLVAHLWRKEARPRDSNMSKITFKCGKFTKPTTRTVEIVDEPTRADKNHSNKLMVYLVSSLTSVVILAVAAGILVRRWQVKRQRQQQAIRSRYQSRAATDGQESVGSELSQPIVMILWCHGCKELENFVLLFAALLQGNGFLVKLDLLDNNVIAEQGGLANYLARGEDDSNYVIVVCTNNEDNSFNFILDIIRNKIMDKGCKARYVPIHIQQEMATVVPPCLQGTTYRVPEKVEEIIQRMYKVPIYTLEEQPVVNTMCLDQTCMESLKKAAASFLKPKHNDCDLANCVKGVEPNERGFETKSYNSFTSDETEMLLVPTLDMAQNNLSCSENSFFGSDLDEEEKF